MGKSNRSIRRAEDRASRHLSFKIGQTKKIILRHSGATQTTTSVMVASLAQSLVEGWLNGAREESGAVEGTVRLRAYVAQDPTYQALLGGLVATGYKVAEEDDEIVAKHQAKLAKRVAKATAAAASSSA